jgi:Fe-Mn family superoxide dismutase
MNTTPRRNFLLATASLAAGSLISPNYAAAKDNENKHKGGLATEKAKPLRYKSIPGFLSESQVAPHHSAHYGGTLKEHLSADNKLHSNSHKISTVERAALYRARTNRANSVVLHELYFDGVTSETTTPSRAVHTAVSKRFGSIDKWAADFQACANAASGWAILAYHPQNGNLYNVVSDRHATGVLWMATPLIIIDVYEHAFYIDYKNNKSRYIEKFISHIDWNEVDHRHKELS